jgi:hypothetical protein
MSFVIQVKVTRRPKETSASAQSVLMIFAKYVNISNF